MPNKFYTHSYSLHPLLFTPAHSYSPPPTLIHPTPSQLTDVALKDSIDSQPLQFILTVHGQQKIYKFVVSVTGCRLCHVINDHAPRPRRR